MHGPQGSYAINGHDRTISIYTPDKRAFVTLICVFSETVSTTIGKAHVNITRNQAAAVIETHRALGYHIETRVNHSEHCICNPDDPRLEKRMTPPTAEETPCWF